MPRRVPLGRAADCVRHTRWFRPLRGQKALGREARSPYLQRRPRVSHGPRHAALARCGGQEAAKRETSPRADRQRAVSEGHMVHGPRPRATVAHRGREEHHCRSEWHRLDHRCRGQESLVVRNGRRHCPQPGGIGWAPLRQYGSGRHLLLRRNQWQGRKDDRAASQDFAIPGRRRLGEGRGRDRAKDRHHERLLPGHRLPGWRARVRAGQTDGSARRCPRAGLRHGRECPAQAR